MALGETDKGGLQLSGTALCPNLADHAILEHVLRRASQAVSEGTETCSSELGLEALCSGAPQHFLPQVE